MTRNPINVEIEDLRRLARVSIARRRWTPSMTRRWTSAWRRRANSARTTAYAVARKDRKTGMAGWVSALTWINATKLNRVKVL